MLIYLDTIHGFYVGSGIWPGPKKTFRVQVYQFYALNPTCLHPWKKCQWEYNSASELQSMKQLDPRVLLSLPQIKYSTRWPHLWSLVICISQVMASGTEIGYEGKTQLIVMPHNWKFLKQFKEATALGRKGTAFKGIRDISDLNKIWRSIPTPTENDQCTKQVFLAAVINDTTDHP